MSLFGHRVTWNLEIVRRRLLSGRLVFRLPRPFLSSHASEPQDSARITRLPSNGRG